MYKYYGKMVKDQWKPTSTTPVTPTPVNTKYYRVRKNWKDKSSQIGAFTVFQNAKNCVDANPGYAAFDDNGNQVYPAVEKCITPYLVQITITDLNYRKGPSTSYASYGFIEPGVYTIVDEQDLLTNVVYKGDYYSHKTVCLVPGKQVMNNGYRDRIYIEEHHEPIVSPELFDRVQERITSVRMNRRSA